MHTGSNGGGWDGVRKLSKRWGPAGLVILAIPTFLHGGRSSYHYVDFGNTDSLGKTIVAKKGRLLGFTGLTISN